MERASEWRCRGTLPCQPEPQEGRVFQDVEYPRRGASGSSTPWSRLLALVGFIGLCVLVELADHTLASRGLKTWYLSLTPPPGALSPRLFGITRVMLCAPGGIAAWLAWQRPAAGRSLRLWGWQLLIGAAWTPAFLVAQQPAFAVVVAGLHVMLTAFTLVAFLRLRPSAALLMVPWLAWTCYAAYFTVGFWWLNAA